jgi:hypothetical protein
MDNMHQQKLNILKKMAQLRGGASPPRSSAPNGPSPKNTDSSKNNASSNGSRGCNACSRKKQS